MQIIYIKKNCIKEIDIFKVEMNILFKKKKRNYIIIFETYDTSYF